MPEFDSAPRTPRPLQAPQALSHRTDIDGLRGVSVLAVLLFHAFPDLLPGGFVGVSVFFVISGFLISRTLWDDIHRQNFSIGRFYARRVHRLFPALSVVLLAIWLFGMATLSWDDFATLGKHVLASSLFGMNFSLLMEGGYFDVAGDKKPLLHLWSLSVEEQFYLLWPLTLLLASRNRVRPGLAIVLLGGLSLGFSALWVAEGKTTLAFYHPVGRAWELLLGCAVGYLWTFRKEALEPLPSLAAPGLVLIIGSSLLFSGDTPFPGLWALVPTVGAAMILLSNPQSTMSRRLFGSRALVGMGLVSYPLYLWHWPLLSFAHILFEESLGPMHRVGILLLSVLLAGLTYRWVEQPLGFKKAGKHGTLALVSAVAALAAGGGLTYLKDGFVNLRAVAQTAPFVVKAQTWEEWAQHVRIGQCYLQDKDTFLHQKECIELVRPRMLLWGDSHAAALYPGLRELQDSRPFGLIQLTQAVCPPLWNVESQHHRHCPKINRRILDSLIELSPETIVLHAAWIHRQYPLPADEVKNRLVKMLREIKARVPSSKIIVIGPQIRWEPSLPRTLARHVEKTGAAPPIFMTPREREISLGVRELEEKLEPAMAAEGVHYIKPRQVFCEGALCRTRISGELVVFDDGHLSTFGSTYFITHIAEQLLAP